MTREYDDAAGRSVVARECIRQSVARRSRAALGGMRVDIASRKSGERSDTDQRVREPGDDEDIAGKIPPDALDLLQLAGQLHPQERVAGAGGEKAAVDHPGIGLDAGPPQILLKRGRLRDGRRLGQGHENDTGVAGSWSRMSGVMTLPEACVS